MIRNENFVIRKIGTQYAIVAVGEATKRFNGMISVNKTGSFIWETLKKECTMETLVAAITDHYEVDAATAKKDAETFVTALKGVGAIEGD